MEMVAMKSEFNYNLVISEKNVKGSFFLAKDKLRAVVFIGVNPGVWAVVTPRFLDGRILGSL